MQVAERIVPVTGVEEDDVDGGVDPYQGHHLLLESLHGLADPNHRVSCMPPALQGVYISLGLACMYLSPSLSFFSVLSAACEACGRRSPTRSGKVGAGESRSRGWRSGGVWSLRTARAGRVLRNKGYRLASTWQKYPWHRFTRFDFGFLKIKTQPIKLFFLIRLGLKSNRKFQTFKSNQTEPNRLASSVWTSGWIRIALTPNVHGDLSVSSLHVQIH